MQLRIKLKENLDQFSVDVKDRQGNLSHITPLQIQSVPPVISQILSAKTKKEAYNALKALKEVAEKSSHSRPEGSFHTQGAECSVKGWSIFPPEDKMDGGSNYLIRANQDNQNDISFSLYYNFGPGRPPHTYDIDGLINFVGAYIKEDASDKNNILHGKNSSFKMQCNML